MNHDVILKGRYKLARKIGQGAFGEIYVSQDLKTNENVAIKLEKGDSKRNVLRAEVNILRKLQGCSFFCRYNHCGTERINDVEFNFLVMELLGENLSEIRKRQTDNKFSIHTTARLGAQMLHCIEEVHESGYLHRDVKPSNFAMGLGQEKQYRCYMIDFGLARRFLMPSGDIRQPRDNAGFRGTARYASVNSHLCKELGRRDDLWSLLYVLVEFLLGSLPWRKLKDKDQIGRVKAEQMQSGDFMVSAPDEIRLMFKHIASLGFAERPNYTLLHQLLHRMFIRSGPCPSSPYDWMQPSALPIPSILSLSFARDGQKSRGESARTAKSQRSRSRKDKPEDAGNGNSMTENGGVQSNTVEGDEAPSSPKNIVSSSNSHGHGLDGDTVVRLSPDDSSCGTNSETDLFAPCHCCKGVRFPFPRPASSPPSGYSQPLVRQPSLTDRNSISRALEKEGRTPARRPSQTQDSQLQQAHPFPPTTSSLPFAPKTVPSSSLADEPQRPDRGASEVHLEGYHPDVDLFVGEVQETKKTSTASSKLKGAVRENGTTPPKKKLKAPKLLRKSLLSGRKSKSNHEGKTRSHCIIS
mmetsp:Transcript_35339/g.57183  ORF Transcript_35339/g.57183 Transcript_35339/m.57183 type:complete len:581 (+) Transcript_35339:112-1854(+)